jgi:hypothetical protein
MDQPNAVLWINPTLLSIILSVADVIHVLWLLLCVSATPATLRFCNVFYSAFPQLLQPSQQGAQAQGQAGPAVR